MKKMRMTQVIRTESLGPHMRRVVLHGNELSDFPTDYESAHFKAIFPKPGEHKPRLGLYPGFKKWMRSYTVRAFDHQKKELTVDFAVNDHEGLATNWAKNAQPGDYLGVAGPGSPKYPDYNADWHLLMADLTGLPAVAAILEKLPADAIGHALLQIPDIADKQAISVPEGVSLSWVINNDLSRNALLEHLETLPWQSGEPSIFVATESGQMKAINRYLKTKPGYQKTKTATSGYWAA